MKSDQTQIQTDEDQRRAQDLSLKRNRPPADVPGYEPRKFLGAGAYGEVWVALDQNTGRHVAIKFYAHRGGLDWSLLSREVEKLVFLSADRYVVQLLHVGRDADPPYYVMEYIEHGSLEDRLRDTGPISLGESVELFREVAIGLSHAHGKGVLHCDLKPANILLDQDQKPRLADFGQSRLSHEQSPALGTLFYMAPEQADLEAVPDARWDVYALGALLYSMLTGQPPHRNGEAISEMDSATDLADRLARYREFIKSAPVPTAHRQVPRMDRALAEIIERCLAVNPKERFANVQSVLDALGRREQAKTRRPMVMTGFVGPALLLLVMTVFGWRGYKRAVDFSMQELTAGLRESNGFAAKFVAEVASRELDQYFNAVEQVATDPEFLDALRNAITNEGLQWQLEDVARFNVTLKGSRPYRVIPHESLEPLGVDEATRFEQAQSKLVNNPQSQRLQAHVDLLIRNNSRSTPAASWFVTDKVGTHLAIAFDRQHQPSTVGLNYAWRTYFHGDPDDLQPWMRPAPVGHTHLSAVFQSTATRTFKVAFSTPATDAEGNVLGMVAMTIDLGNVVKFQGTDSRFAVLVDGRPGPNLGLILEHPLFDQVLASGNTLPEEFSSYRVDLENWRESDVEKYQDPLAKDVLGTAYRREWIAAKAPVQIAIENGNGHSNDGLTDTGWFVLVQEDYHAAANPVERLGMSLVRDGLAALGVVLIVILSLWYFVVRVLSDSGQDSSFVPTTTFDPTPLHSRETIDQVVAAGHSKS